MKLEWCRDRTPPSPIGSFSKVGVIPPLSGNCERRASAERAPRLCRTPPPGLRFFPGRVAPAPAGCPCTCSSAPGCPAASCAPAGAARADAGRRARCTLAATPRSCSCTRRAAAAPTCCSALPWPATTGREGGDEKRHSEAPGKQSAAGTWEQPRVTPVVAALESWSDPAVLGAGDKPPLRPPEGQQLRTPVSPSLDTRECPGSEPHFRDLGCWTGCPPWAVRALSVF